MSRVFENGLVSVITPVYNAERFLENTIISVMAQTYQNVEMVLVDDCSSDNSAAIIDRCVERFGAKIIYHRFERNQGAGIARNKALELAKGQFVAFLDSDDVWLPNKLECQLRLMEKTESPFSYTAIEMIDENSHVIKRKRSIKEICDYNYLLHNTIIATSSVLVDRNEIGDFRMHPRRGGQDYATWLMILQKGVVARGINEVYVQYRISNNSLSSNKLKSIKQIWEIQTKDQGIVKTKALWNIICFSFNGIKKYFF